MTKTHINREGREIVVAVSIDASPSSAWTAYASPDKIRKWWPFEGMTMTVCENDVRVGGAFRFVGRAPDGSEHAFSGAYLEVDPNERVVHTERYEAFPGPEARCTVTFAERDGGTELTSRMVFATDESFQDATDSGLPTGMEDSLQRLADLATSRELSISRLIDAPRERLFAAWTDPELLARWFAPRPLTTPVCEVDPRPGGRCLTVMRTPEGEEYRNEGVFLEVVPNERIVFTDAFKEGWQTTPNPFMVGVISLEERDGKTLYTATVRHWSVADRERHEAMGFETGWNQCLDQLVELVARKPQTA